MPNPDRVHRAGHQSLDGRQELGLITNCTPNTDVLGSLRVVGTCQTCAFDHRSRFVLVNVYDRKVTVNVLIGCLRMVLAPTRPISYDTMDTPTGDDFMGYQLKDLQYQRAARDPQVMLENLRRDFNLKISVGIWYGDESQEKRCRHEVGRPGLRELRLVTAEPQPHRRQEAVGKGIVDPRPEPLQQRQRDYGGRHREVDSFLHHPSSLTRVGHIWTHIGKTSVGGERLRHVIKEPRADDTPVPPQLRYLRQVEIHIRSGLE